QWATQAEARVSNELKSQDPTIRSRKKKTLKWWCVFGLVTVRERIWRSQTQSYVRPLPQRLGVTPRGRSRRLQRVLTDFGCEKAFARAAESVLEHYGFAVGSTAVRTATLAHAQRARAKLQAQAKGSTTTCYGATFGSVAETGQRWWHCTRQAGWGLNSQIHAVGDGAEWIRMQCREVFGEQATFLFDFFHVSEYLGHAAPSCRPAQPNQWRRTQQQRLRRGDVQKVIAALKEHLEPVGTVEEEAPVRNGHRYVSNRKDYLDYPRALALGLPIGSGMIESGHRHVLQARL